MKKIILPLFLLLTLTLVLTSCITTPSNASGEAPTVSSCEFVSVTDGVETWKLTYSDGTTKDLTVKGRTETATPTFTVSSCEKTATIGLTDTYTVTFKDAAGAVISTQSVAAGENATLPAAPSG